MKDVFVGVRKLDGGYVLDNNHTETDEGQSRILYLSRNCSLRSNEFCLKI